MALAFMNNTHINIKKANKATKHDFILSRPVHISLAPFHFMTIISSYSKVTFSQTCTLSLSTQLLQPPYLWWKYWCVWIYSAVQFYTICNTQRAGMDAGKADTVVLYAEVERRRHQCELQQWDNTMSSDDIFIIVQRWHQQVERLVGLFSQSEPGINWGMENYIKS